MIEATAGQTTDRPKASENSQISTWIALQVRSASPPELELTKMHPRVANTSLSALGAHLKHGEHRPHGHGYRPPDANFNYFRCKRGVSIVRPLAMLGQYSHARS